MAKIRILEVDQFHAHAMLQDMMAGEAYTFKDFKLERIRGGDADAAKRIFGGDARIREV